MNIELIKEITDYGIIGILGLMSFLSVWFYFERLLFFKQLNLTTYKHKEQLEIDITNHISIISSFGSNAPYIGLLGTVFGIIITFYTMGQGGDIDVKIIMSSLGLALKATAMGLVVAIPAIVAYTIALRKVERILTLFDVAADKKKA